MTDIDRNSVSYRRRRMRELFRPIERQILLTDDEEDLVMLASLMMTTSKDILVQRIGSEKAKRMVFTMDFGDQNMPHPHKNRPRKGRRKVGSAKRKARRLKGKKSGKK